MFTMPSGKSVFIVEDDSTVQFLLKMYLQGKWNVQSSYSAEEATLAIGGLSPDIVLTDYNLPGKNGIELFQAIRSSMPNTRFVMMTSMEDESLQKRAMELGFDRFMRKPIKRSALLRELDALAD